MVDSFLLCAVTCAVSFPCSRYIQPLLLFRVSFLVSVAFLALFSGRLRFHDKVGLIPAVYLVEVHLLFVVIGGPTQLCRAFAVIVTDFGFILFPLLSPAFIVLLGMIDLSLWSRRALSTAD